MSKITKLGFGIVAFEGTEHIKNIAYEIRDLVDEIVVCLQTVSYHNAPIAQEDVDTINKLIELGLVDKLIWFEPDLSYLNKDLKGADYGQAPRLVETDKRNYILDVLEKDGCSHSMIIDSDEFYDHDDFKLGKEVISNSENMHATYCRYVNYWRDYKHYLMWPFPAFVPFIFESHYRFEFKGPYVNFAIDPTRIIKMNTDEEYHTFHWKFVKMHHFSWIRLDITKKIDSWSAKRFFEQDGDKFLKKIYDRYTNWKETDNAILMFQVPFCEVSVRTMREQYIHPHYRLDEEPVKYVKNSDSSDVCGQ